MVTLLERDGRDESLSLACGKDLCDVGDELIDQSGHGSHVRRDVEVMELPKLRGKDIIR